VVDNDLIYERLIMGSLNKGVLLKKIQNTVLRFVISFQPFFFLVANSVLAVLTLLLLEAAV